MGSEMCIRDRPPCFTQIRILQWSLNSVMMESCKDSAGLDGSFLYGGLLDRCLMKKSFPTIGPENSIPYNLFSKRRVVRVRDSEDNQTGEITSPPYQLCFCDADEGYHCSGTLYVSIHRGQRFSVYLAALDQLKATISTTVNAKLSPHVRLHSDQNTQTLQKQCTHLTYLSLIHI